MNERNKTFAKNLRKLRDSLRLDQDELAFKIGVNTRTYQKYEYGKASPRDAIKQKLADILKVSVSDLYNDNINGQTPVLVSISNTSRADLILSIQSLLLTLNEDQLRSLSLAAQRLVERVSADITDESAV